jgi:hypothetical protein
MGLSPGHIRVNRGYENLAELSVNKLVAERPDVLWKGPLSEKLRASIEQQVIKALRDAGLTSDQPIDAREYDYGSWIDALCRLLLRIRD